MEQQLEQADKKIAKQLHTIQKLNHDKDWRDEEIFNLEEAGVVLWSTWYNHFDWVTMTLGLSWRG